MKISLQNTDEHENARGGYTTVHTFHVHDGGKHIATVIHRDNHENGGLQVIYHPLTNGKNQKQIYGTGGRKKHIHNYINDSEVNYHNDYDVDVAHDQVASAVKNFHSSSTGKNFLNARHKVEASMQESTLNKIRRVLNLGESTSQNTYSDLFRYHDDMYHQKPRPGNQIHTKLHDPIHDRLRKNAAAQHYNLTGERLTSKDGKSYPPPEFKTESTGVRKATKADLEYMIQDHERQAHIVATASPNSIRPVTRQALAAHHKRKAIEYRELLAKHFPDTKNESTQIAAKKARGLGESTNVDHEDKFWNHIRLAYKSLSVSRARQHSSLAIDHAKKHFEKTGKKIDAEGILDGLPTGHESYLKY